MDFTFTKFAKALPNTGNVSNGTDPLALTQLSPNILEALIPGYGPISRYMLAAFGIDISIFVSIALIAVGGSKAGRYLYGWIEEAFRATFMSTIHIDEWDDLFDMVMIWLAENHGAVSGRSARAKTQYGSSADDALDFATTNALDEHGMFDYNKWSARTPPRYEPYYGRRMFWFKGRIFWFRRLQKPSQNRVTVVYHSGRDDDMIELTCIGRNTQPIRELLKEVKACSLNKLRGSTTIRHPTPKDRARFGGSWNKTTSRPSRPMDTVILDPEQKTTIIKDMNEYLHPASPKWYAARGIPYRRGYLFHGPPGTGKTSLSFALAGIFGLDIYAISLQEPTLTEGDLMMLFNSLPRRCVVLLEDVDAAGLLRDGKSDKTGGDNKDRKKAKGDGLKDGNKKDEGKGPKKEDDKVASKNDEEYTLRDVMKDLARELKSMSSGKGGDKNSTESRNGHPNRAPGTGISLSGLLNVIDGVATHEGRVLIMTTNHPEKLDAALTRPGRVDRRVEFKLAMKEQVRELFVRMYASSDMVPDQDELKLHSKTMNGHAKASYLKKLEANGHTNGLANGHTRDKSQLAGISEADLDILALEFSEHVPDDTFTPAEIQNHLMRHKKEPFTAVETVEVWIRETLEEKEKLKDAKEEGVAGESKSE